jgi:DNA-binding transcriptional ArsR family regulator
MSAQPELADAAALIGEPSRAAMLDALLGGRWLAAGELASAAGVSRATASEHLARLLAGGLVIAERHGRHRYFALAGAHVAAALEALGALTDPRPRTTSLRQTVRLHALRAGRTCYDHLAGELGVALTDGLLHRGWLADADGGWTVTARGEQGFADLGIDVAVLRARPRPLTRRCLDWTERRHHLAGELGAAVTLRLRDLGWTAELPHARAVRLTASGRSALRQLLQLEQQV